MNFIWCEMNVAQLKMDISNQSSNTTEWNYFYGETASRIGDPFQ